MRRAVYRVTGTWTASCGVLHDPIRQSNLGLDQRVLQVACGSISHEVT